MANQGQNNNNNNPVYYLHRFPGRRPSPPVNRNDTYEEERVAGIDIRLVKESNKSIRDEENDGNYNEGPKSKRQKLDDGIKSDVSEDSVSDKGEESETERIVAKYSKRAYVIRDCNKRNEFLDKPRSEQDIINKLYNDKTISKEEFEALSRVNKKMDEYTLEDMYKDIYKDEDSKKDMELYKKYRLFIAHEFDDNAATIDKHYKKISGYKARLAELSKEKNEMPSNDKSNLDNNSSDNNNNNPIYYLHRFPGIRPSPSVNPNNSSDLRPSASVNPNNSSGSSNSNNDNEFDDFPSSFDFDDF